MRTLGYEKLQCLIYSIYRLTLSSVQRSDLFRFPDLTEISRWRTGRSPCEILLKVHVVELELIVFIFFEISTTLLKLWLFDYNLECQTYQTLTSSKRKATWSSTSVECDSSKSGWYRFTEGAGTKMPTTCVPMHRCNTHATGWLNGNHPTVADGQVTRQVCFHWSSDCCLWSTNIQVRNCGEYFVYLLSGTPGCSLRYCGTD